MRYIQVARPPHGQVNRHTGKQQTGVVPKTDASFTRLDPSGRDYIQDAYLHSPAQYIHGQSFTVSRLLVNLTDRLSKPIFDACPASLASLSGSCIGFHYPLNQIPTMSVPSKLSSPRPLPVRQTSLTAHLSQDPTTTRRKEPNQASTPKHEGTKETYRDLRLLAPQAKIKKRRKENMLWLTLVY